MITNIRLKIIGEYTEEQIEKQLKDFAHLFKDVEWEISGKNKSIRGHYVE